MFNSFGRLFRITTFGESHGPAMGVVIDGCPAGLKINEDLIQIELDRRKPGQSTITTQRKEEDNPEILSGIFKGITTGSPIAITFRNKDAKEKDYSELADKFRPSHADFTYQEKFGIRDFRGGGRSSARETVNWVAAGAIAKSFLTQKGISIKAYVTKVGPLECSKNYTEMDLESIDSNIVRCPDQELASEMIDYIEETRQAGDSIGGVISCVAFSVPVGLGEPIFNKLHAELGHAMLTINAVKGIEFGSGFKAAEMHGSKHNDEFVQRSSGIETRTNFSGGIQGGISNGQDIYFNIAFKPVATIIKDQQSVDQKGNEVTIKGKGRHDPCVLPRAVPIVEAMTALVLTDFYLLNQSSKL